MALAHHRTGAGPPLLLVHGIGSQWQMWEPVLDALAAEHEVIAVDLPGFGDSPPLTGEPTVTALAAAVHEFLAEQGIERPHVAGNSLGGGVALVLGAAGRARSVCCLSPIGFARGREPLYQRAVLRTSRAGARALEPVADWGVGGPARRAIAFGHLSARPWRLRPEGAAGALRNLARSPGFSATLRAIGSDWRAPVPGCPTTIAWGDRDRLLIFSRQAPRARRQLPAARHVTLHGCGHVPTWDDPAQVARVLLEASRGS